MKYRSKLGIIKGDGQAHGGSHEWVMHKLTAIPFIVLAAFFIYFLRKFMVTENYDAYAGLLDDVFIRLGLILFFIVALKHGIAELRVIVEDYVASKKARACILLTLYIVYYSVVIFGIIAVLN